VDFNLDSPALIFSSRIRNKLREIKLPLFLEDGLFSLSATPFPLDDTRFSSLRKVDVTLGGVFRPSDSSLSHRWTSKILVSTNPGARFLVASHSDFDYNLQSFCGNFLAPLSIPVSRRQYDPAISRVGHGSFETHH
jgi:hypothetical protein